MRFPNGIYSFLIIDLKADDSSLKKNPSEFIDSSTNIIGAELFDA